MSITFPTTRGLQLFYLSSPFRRATSDLSKTKSNAKGKLIALQLQHDLITLQMVTSKGKSKRKLLNYAYSIRNQSQYPSHNVAGTRQKNARVFLKIKSKSQGDGASSHTISNRQRIRGRGRNLEAEVFRSADSYRAVSRGTADVAHLSVSR